MGPITLFDKSFLQSLSLDESVWFDNFFLANICPLFYVETLADLEKAVREGRTPEEEVRIIADKTPEMHGGLNAYHGDLCVANLMGHDIPMVGRIPVSGGYPVKFEGKIGVVYRQSPEAQAFSRWQEGKFLEVERLFAAVWRKALASVDLYSVKRVGQRMGIQRTCRSLQEAKELSDTIVASGDNPFERMKMMFLFLTLPKGIQVSILKRWISHGSPPLHEFAPYAAYVLSVEVFFHIAVGANLISPDRHSNRTDIAYLFYLPFCMVFVSLDKLHRTCAPFFLRSNQDFIWGEGLKTDLRTLNEHYSKLPEPQKEEGIMKIASRPPVDEDFLVTRLWDRHLAPDWRTSSGAGRPRDQAKDKALVEHLKMFTKAPPINWHEAEEPEMVSIERMVRKRKGSWRQVPKGLPNED